MRTRAALFHTVGQPFELAEIDLDEPRDDEVVVRMVAAGICGTDLHQVKGEFRRPTPIVLGHEGAGVVEAVGASVTRVHVGDEVVLSWAPFRRPRAPHVPLTPLHRDGRRPKRPVRLTHAKYVPEPLKWRWRELRAVVIEGDRREGGQDDHNDCLRGRPLLSFLWPQALSSSSLRR